LISLLGLLVLLSPAAVAALAIWEPEFARWPWWTLLGVLMLTVIDHLISRRLAVVELRRQTQSTLSMGAKNDVTVAVRNLSRIPLRLTVKDDPPPEFNTPRREHPLRLGPYEDGWVTYQTIPRARGDYAFGNLHVRGRTIAGLSFWQKSFPAEEHVAVYPNVAQVAQYEELARSGLLTQVGYHPYRRIGTGTNFESLREYVPDDEYRHIDWKATARRRKPITRQHEAERSQNVMIMIDAGRLMAGTAGEMSKLDYAINAALMLAYVATRRDDRVGLLAFDDEVQQFVQPGKGTAQVGRISDALYDLQPQLREPDYAVAFATLHARARKRALVICFTDLIDKDASARLLSGMASLFPRHLPLLIAIQDPDLLSAAGQTPSDEFEVYEKAIAIQSVGDRADALSAITRRGVLVLDAPPEDLTVATVNRYLEIKERHAL
jgi:uncharacterized protein (DUF58 family)